MIIFIYLYMNYNDYNTQKLRGLKRKLELIKSRGVNYAAMIET